MCERGLGESQEHANTGEEDGVGVNMGSSGTVWIFRSSCQHDCCFSSRGQLPETYPRGEIDKVSVIEGQGGLLVACVNINKIVECCCTLNICTPSSFIC